MRKGLAHYDSELTFVEQRYSSGNLAGDFHPKFGRGKSTPRIVRAINRISRKFDLDEDRSPKSVQPGPGSSKSSVVLLFHEKSYHLASSSLKQDLRSSRSDQAIPRERFSQAQTTVALSPHHPRAVKGSGIESTKCSSCRQRASQRGHRCASGREEPFHRSVQHCDPPKIRHDTNESRENFINSGKESSGYERKIYKKAKYNSRDHLMACCSSPDRDGDRDQRNNANLIPPGLDSLMQRVQGHPRERGDDRTFISVNDGDESSRVFPFQATPSGNLKIVPNQVVFESKKVSVLVADPKRTKVNVKAELSRPGISGGVDLLSGNAGSIVNQLQSREQDCVPRMQRARGQMQLEQPEETATVRQTPTMNQVALSSLGFTSEQPIDWNNITLPEKTDLYQELARRIMNYKNADCIVRIDQDEFHCHLLVLQSYSSFFDERNCKKIDLTGSDVSSKAFSAIYDWMIRPPAESCYLLRRDNILEIFRAAQYLAIKELEEQCWAFIDNDELFTEDTAFLLYLDARKVKNTAVMELMLPRIMKFFLMLVSTKDFLELSVEELCLLLRSNYICVNSEMEVLMSAVRWLMHDWNSRKQHMLDVLKCVRFGLIAPWQLVDVKRNPENPEFIELMSYPEVQKMVDDGLAFVIIKYWYANQTEDYYHWIHLLGLTEPTNRNWAGEDKNYVTYREFLLYLEEYQKTKVQELKNRKSQPKPSYPDSSSNDQTRLNDRARAGAYAQNNFQQETSTAATGHSNPTGCPIQANLQNLVSAGLPVPIGQELFTGKNLEPGKFEAKGVSKPSVTGMQTNTERRTASQKLQNSF